MTDSHGVKMIAGLGNPGKEYGATRHNVGFRVIDLLADAFGADLKKTRFGAKFGECRYKDSKVILLKPWQYMNRSGESIAAAALFYKVDLSDLLVVLDDMWLEPGQIRLRAKGSAGGHNGLADIIEKLGSDAFPRLRIGIGRSESPDAVGHVLGIPDGPQGRLIAEAIDRAKEAVTCWLGNGIDAAMTGFNRFEKEGEKQDNN